MLTGPLHLDPAAVYTDGDLRIGLGLTSSALARARRMGRLRHTRQGRSILYRGEWVIAWLERESRPEQTAEPERSTRLRQRLYRAKSEPMRPRPRFGSTRRTHSTRS